MVNESLAEIYARHATVGDVGTGDKGTVHSYIPVYEKLLAPYRDKCDLLEIGLGGGQSLAMWQEYLLRASTITGVDISVAFDRTPFQAESDAEQRVAIIEADATKPEWLYWLGKRSFDIIIDDGSHMEADQIATFNLLKHRMKPGGLYIIEDVLNLEWSRAALTGLHPDCEVIDLRAKKGRFDDVLIKFQF